MAGLSGPFGLIHRGIGVAHYVLGRAVARRSVKNADAGGTVNLVAVQFKGDPEFCLDTFGDTRDLFVNVGALDEDSKLVTAEASHEVRRPETLAEPFGNTHQQHVASQMSETVIYVFEAVEVNKQDADPIVWRQLATLKGRCQTSHEQRAVRQAGQGVVGRFVLEFLFGDLFVGDVLDLEDQSLVLDISVAGSGDTPRCPHDVAVLMKIAVFQLTARDLAGDQFVEFYERRAKVVRNDHRLKVPGQKLLFRKTEYLGQGPVDLEPRSGRTDESNADRGIVERTSKPLFGLAQGVRLSLHHLGVLFRLFRLLDRDLDVLHIHPVGKIYKDHHRKCSEDNTDADRVGELDQDACPGRAHKVREKCPNVFGLPGFPDRQAALQGVIDGRDRCIGDKLCQGNDRQCDHKICTVIRVSVEDLLLIKRKIIECHHDERCRYCHRRGVEKDGQLFVAKSPRGAKSLKRGENYRKFASVKQQCQEYECVRDCNVRFESRNGDRDPRPEHDRQDSEQHQVTVHPLGRHRKTRGGQASPSGEDDDRNVPGCKSLAVH